jgi:hypothetical protein
MSPVRKDRGEIGNITVLKVFEKNRKEEIGV